MALAPTLDRPPTASTPGPGLASALRPLVLDAALPVGAYLVAHDALGVSLVGAITISSVITLVRTVQTLVCDRTINQLALLVLASNVAALVFGLTTGDARFLVAKDSGVSSVVALGILVSVVRGRPLMSAGMTPFLTRGVAGRVAALEHLRATGRTLALETRYSLVWGVLLLVECIARLIGAYTVAPATMAWASTVLTVGAIALATVVGGAVAAAPLQALVDGEVAAGRE